MKPSFNIIPYEKFASPHPKSKEGTAPSLLVGIGLKSAHTILGKHKGRVGFTVKLS